MIQMTSFPAVGLVAFVHQQGHHQQLLSVRVVSSTVAVRVERDLNRLIDNAARMCQPVNIDLDALVRSSQAHLGHHPTGL